MIKPCPCNGCTERFLACSDRCPKDARGDYGHKAWKGQHQAQQKHIADNRNRWGVPMTAARERAYRNLHNQGSLPRKKGTDL